MDIKLSQQLAQKLILSPQIQLYLKMLQLPITELSQSVEQELIENPVLESVTETSDSVDDNASHETSEREEAQEKAELEFEKRVDILAKLDENFKENYFQSHSEPRHESLEEIEKKQIFRESLIVKKTTLTEYLNWQCHFLDLPELQKKIAEEMIGNVSNDGYFRLNLSEVATQFQTSVRTVEEVLQALQTLDPPGVFGRTLQEVLLLQMERCGATPVSRLAYKILAKHFDAFERRNYQQIARQLKVSSDEIDAAVRLICSLEPKPGRTFFASENFDVVVDVTIHPPETERDEYKIEIHDETIPSLRISQYYRELLKDKSIDSKTKEYIKQKINAGFWFIKAIDQRKSTLRQITEEIVKVQHEFFEKGFAFLKPLTLKDIAEKINIHESTVSRALSGKFVNTPQGTIPFKSFFSNKLPTYEGDFESQKSVMAKIKKMVDQEDSQKPLSDSKITELMNQGGIKIARRTVAKYRELMKILPSHMRRTR